MKKMNSLLSSVLLFLLLFTACKKEEKKNDLEEKKNDLTEEGLKGNVKEILLVSVIKFDNNIDCAEKVSLTKYNPDGYKIFEEQFGGCGGNNGAENPSTTEILRDTKNNKIEEKIIEGDFKQIIKYSYDKNNKLETSKEIINDADKNVTKYKYDAKGNVISEMHYSQDGTITTRKYNNKYDNELLVEKTGSNVGSEDFEKDVYKYNENQELIFEQQVRKIQASIYTTTTEKKYNDKGLLIEEKSKIDKETPTIYNYYYDKNNNLIERKMISNGEVMSDVTYLYDEIGNWLEETNKTNKGTTYIKKRQIEYYSDNNKTDSINEIQNKSGQSASNVKKIVFKENNGDSKYIFTFHGNDVKIIKYIKDIQLFEENGNFLNGVVFTNSCSDCYRIGRGDDGEWWNLEVSKNNELLSICSFDEKNSNVTYEELTNLIQNGSFDKTVNSDGVDLSERENNASSYYDDNYHRGNDGRIYENNRCGLCRGTGVETARNMATGEMEGRTCPMCDGRGVRSY